MENKEINLEENNREEINQEEVRKVETEADEVMRVTDRAIELLRTVYDPEIPVNVYDLGLIYKIDYDP